MTDIKNRSALAILVQASSTSWGGGINLCMNPIDGIPALTYTLRRLVETFPQERITIIAPAFDESNLDEFTSVAGAVAIEVLYAHDASPLLRMLEAVKSLPDDTLILRVDGLNFCVDAVSLATMWDLAQQESLDLVKYPDDWPSLFTADLYRVGALRRMLAELETLPDDLAKPHHIHPKYHLLANADRYRCHRYRPAAYDTATLQLNRERAKIVFEEREQACDEKRSVPAADTRSFHYRLALNYLTPEDRVLDIACGYGFGSAMLANKVAEVIGADLDAETLVIVAEKYKQQSNLTFQAANGLSMPFADNSFDAIVSFETIEHLDADGFLKEVQRVLQPGGRFIMSTPQNALGHVPINPHHIIEYSLEQITAKVASYLSLEKVMGIKQGTIMFEDDPTGSNTILVCRKA